MQLNNAHSLYRLEFLSTPFEIVSEPHFLNCIYVGVVILQSDKVILTTMTKEMHKKGSKCIENNLMNVKDIPLSSSFEKDVFKQNGWDVVIDKIQSENPIMVQIQVKMIFF